jgi:hypothetical protein
MIVTICAIVASVSGAVFAAHKVAAPKTEKVIHTPIDRTSLVTENTLLADKLIKELNRIKSSTNRNPADLDLVLKSFEIIIKTSWPKDTYYYRKSITPFINVLRVSGSLEREQISSRYCTLLSEIIQSVVPTCSEAIIRGDDGDSVNDFAFNTMRSLDNKTVQLESHNRKAMAKLTELNQGVK